METNGFVPTCVCCRRLSRHRKEQWSEVDYLVARYYFVPCTFWRDFSNGIEYFEGSGNIFIPPRGKKGINGHKHECKSQDTITNVSSNSTIHVVGASVYHGLSTSVEERGWEHWLSGLYWSKKFNLSILHKLGFACTDYLVRRAQARTNWPQKQGSMVCHL